MKKTILLVCVLTAALPCAAQKNLFKWFKSFRTPAAPVAAPVQFRTVQGKKLPLPSRPVVSSRQLELEKFVARRVLLTRGSQLPFVVEPQNFDQLETFISRYRETMGKFKEFKHETSPFLYYRLKDPKRTDGLRREDEHLLAPTIEMERRLLRLSAVVDPKKDEPLAFALEYVGRVRDELAPMLKGMGGNGVYFARTDRKFVGDEFYLHDGEFKRWTDMLRRGRTLKEALQLPSGLRVAVLNDRPSVLENMQKSHQNGIFVRGGTLDCFSQADALIASVRGGKEYDLIITDIIVPGGGGYYVTKELRLDGFSGAIIALSAYERDDSMGMEMFERGFDGMLNLPIAFEHSPFWESDVLRGLNNYFHLKKINKWQR